MTDPQTREQRLHAKVQALETECDRLVSQLQLALAHEVSERVRRKTAESERDKLSLALKIISSLDLEQVIDEAKLAAWRASFENDPPERWLDAISMCHQLAATATSAYSEVKHANRALVAERDEARSVACVLAGSPTQANWANADAKAHLWAATGPRS